MKELQKINEIPDLIEIKKIQDNIYKDLSASPDPRRLKNHPTAKGVKYLEIGYIEFYLDRTFLQWDVQNLEVKLIVNAVVVSLDLVVTTIAGNKITRSGVGACEVQTKKGSAVLTPETITYAAMERNVPAARTAALKNAAASLGNKFGRSLNRDFKHEHIPDEELPNRIYKQ